MRIERIKVRDVRNFIIETNFSFQTSEKINTVSGVNGSGKTSIFKLLLLCQKAFFVEQLEYGTDYKKEIGKELAKFFNSKESFIEIVLDISDQEVISRNPSFKLYCVDYHLAYIVWDIEISPTDKNLIRRYWNLDNPSHIIAYIDSNRSFVEDDTQHSNISVSNNTKKGLLIETILHPEKLITLTYRSLINDYLSERLVPSSERRDLYLIPTKILLKELIPQLEIANFSGSHFENQFVLLGKSSVQKKAKRFDIRNFSSGEKTIFYVLLFINYIRNVGMLIIDEPENHFHEELLTRFVKLLSQIADPNINYGELIMSIARKNKITIEESGKKGTGKSIRQLYGKGYLSQVFLLTHSKNLIYNTFDTGKNFYLDHDFIEIKSEEAELRLREIGLSSIYSKVLFVEGSSDSTFLTKFLSAYNIKIHPLGSCSEVITTYKKVSNISQHLKDSHFCYLIDRDTRSDAEIAAIAKDKQTYFKRHFKVLERHEFENYFLQTKLWFDLYQKHKTIASLADLTENEIAEMIKKAADETKLRVFEKKLKSLNEQSISYFNKFLVPKSIPVKNSTEYNEFYNKTIEETNISKELLIMYKFNYEICKREILDAWENDWQSKCDGKSVFKTMLSTFSKKIEIYSTRLEGEIKNMVDLSKDYEASKIVDEILGMFQI